MITIFYRNLFQIVVSGAHNGETASLAGLVHFTYTQMLPSAYQVATVNGTIVYGTVYGTIVRRIAGAAAGQRPIFAEAGQIEPSTDRSQCQASLQPAD